MFAFAHWYDEVHKAKLIAGSVAKCFAFVNDVSRSIDQLRIIFEDVYIGIR